MKRLLIAFVVVLAGCASPQVVYYTLTPATSLDPVAVDRAPEVTPYTLTRVTVPPQSDDLSIVVRDIGDKLLVLTYDRWTVSLSSEVTQAVAIALTDELGVPPQQAWTSASSNASNEVQIDVQRFELLPGDAAYIAASWRIKFKQVGNKAVKPAQLTCYAVFKQSAAPGVLPLVQAQQKNIQLLSQMVAQTLRSGQPIKGARCS